jgi:hypothetical protein
VHSISGCNCVQCKEEISRLEVEQAKTMRAIIQRNVAEVSQLCEATGLPLPDLSAILAGSESENHVAEALHKLNVMLAQLKTIVAAREPIIKAVREVEEAFKEAHWHFQHQQDNVLNNRVRGMRASADLHLIAAHAVEAS